MECFFSSPEKIKKEIADNSAFGFWGLYKTKGDTLYVEYLYNPSSPGVAPFEHRNTLTGLLKDNEIIVTEHASIKYSFPANVKDSLTSSCIGKFVNSPVQYNQKENYLKSGIYKYQ